MKTRRRPRVCQKKSAKALKNAAVQKFRKAKRVPSSKPDDDGIKDFHSLKIKYLELLKKVEILEKKVNKEPEAGTSKPQPEETHSQTEQTLNRPTKPVPDKYQLKKLSVNVSRILPVRNSKSRESATVGKKQVKPNNVQSKPALRSSKISKPSVAGGKKSAVTSVPSNTRLAASPKVDKVVQERKAEVKSSKLPTAKAINRSKVIKRKNVKKPFRREPINTPANRTCRVVPRVTIDLVKQEKPPSVDTDCTPHHGECNDDHDGEDHVSEYHDSEYLGGEFSGRTTPLDSDPESKTEFSGEVSPPNQSPEVTDNKVSFDNEVPDAAQNENCLEEPPLIIHLAESGLSLPPFKNSPEDFSEKFDFGFRTAARIEVSGELTTTMCRVCGRYELQCMDIFGEGGQISKLMVTFLPLESITEEDPLPLTICLDCTGVLQATDDLAFRCLMAEPLFRPPAATFYPGVVAIVDVLDESWRVEVNNKVIDKFITDVPTIEKRLERRLSIDTAIIETCHVCGRKDVTCLENCEEYLFLSIINTYLPFEFPESQREFFHACLECVGILQVMDDLSSRFFSVESCLRNHYKLFQEISVVPSKNHCNTAVHEDSDAKVVEICKSRPSGEFPNYNAMTIAVEDPLVYSVEEMPDNPNKNSAPLVDHDYLHSQPALKNVDKRSLSLSKKIKLLKADVPFTATIETPSPQTNVALLPLENKSTESPSTSPSSGKSSSWVTVGNTPILGPSKNLADSPHMLRFQMMVWHPAKKFSPAHLSNPSKQFSLLDIAALPKNTVPPLKDIPWVVIFKYEVYYNTANGVCVPLSFKLCSNVEDWTAKFILETVRDSLRREMLLLKQQSIVIERTNAAKNFNIILQNSILCIHCNKLVPRTKLLNHFKQAHMIPCTNCPEYVLSPDSLFNHLTEDHNYPTHQCSICTRRFTKSEFFCKHYFTCFLCARNCGSYKGLIHHEEQHYRAMKELDEMLKQLDNIPAEVGHKYAAVEKSDACSVCGKPSEDADSKDEHAHTFTCNKCLIVFFNHPLYLRHRCGKSRQLKQIPEKVPLPRVFFSCPICESCMPCDELEYRQHYIKCFRYLLAKSRSSPVLPEAELEVVPVGCSLCGVVCPNINDFYIHYFVCVKEKTFTCDVCSNVLLTSNSLEHSCKSKSAMNFTSSRPVSRTEIDQKLTPFHECFVCGAGFIHTSYLCQHFKTHPPSNRCCPICKVYFDQHFLGSFIKHLTQHSAEQLKPVTEGLPGVKCTNCEAVFESHLSKVVHNILSHPPAIYDCLNCKEQFISAEAKEAHDLWCPDRQIWTCSLCSQEFSKNDDYKQHALSHYRTTSCSACKIFFKSRTHLGLHLRVAHPEKSFICKYCARSFVFADSLTRHYKTRHKQEILCCALCYKTFPSEKKLAAHESEHGVHDCTCSFCVKKKTQPPVIFYSCDSCCKTFDYPLDLYTHTVSKHPCLFTHRCAKCNLSFCSNKAYKMHSVECAESSSNFLCESCGECFEDKTELRKHAASHKDSLDKELIEDGDDAGNELVEEAESEDPERVVHCPLCNNSFKGNNFLNLLRHCQAHDPVQLVEVSCGGKIGPIKCSFQMCNKRFLLKVQCFLHEIYHHNILLYQCPVCHSEFSSRNRWLDHGKRCLKEYENKHQPINQNTQISIRCRMCKESFADQFSVIAHKNTVHCLQHYKCNICFKTYGCAKYLHCHMQNVHSKQNYNCPDCGKLYSSRKSYLAHISQHESAKHRRSFACDLCNMTFLSAAGLKNHARMHSIVQNHPCSECPLKFLHAREMYRHRKQVHNVLSNRKVSVGLGDRPRKSSHKYFPLMNYCKSCCVYFNNWHELRKHCFGTTRIGSYSCDAADCDEKFNDECSLTLHKRSHRPWSACELCDKTFSHVRVRHFHYQIEHNSIFPFHCNHCNRGFSSGSSCQMHQKVCNPPAGSLKKGPNKENTLGTKRQWGIFSCSFCPKLFHKRQDQIIHFKSAHPSAATDSTTYTCRICGCSHACYSSLVNHTRIHYRNTDGTGLSCPICGYSNTKLQMLMEHECKAGACPPQIQQGVKKRKRPRNTQQETKEAAMQIQPYISEDVILTSDPGISPKQSVQAITEFPSEFRQIVDEALEVKEVVVHSESDMVTESLVLNDNFVYICSFCDSSFESVSHLQTHLMQIHDLDLKDLELQLVQ